MNLKIKSKIIYLLNKFPYISSLNEKIAKQGKYPAGHYYSPIPNINDIILNINSKKFYTMDLADIEMNSDQQISLLKEYQKYYNELQFPENPDVKYRYYYNQKWFCYADAIFLYSFLRKHIPRKIIEVGSGFSSAVILDTIEKYFSNKTEIIFIEPNNERLLKIFRKNDRDMIRLIEKNLQDVPIKIFKTLEEGDLLFIDSSHVIKYKNDLYRLFFEILPILPKGIFVHFHDIFFPFEYPSEWILQGRYWNEIYFLRAFLAYNNTWKINFFNHYISLIEKNYLKKQMPLCLKNPGGSLYIQKV